MGHYLPLMNEHGLPGVVRIAPGSHVVSYLRGESARNSLVNNQNKSFPPAKPPRQPHSFTNLHSDVPLSFYCNSKGEIKKGVLFV